MMKIYNLGLKRYKDIKIYFLFLILVWLVYYLKLWKFGLYEDDYWFAGIPANSSFRELLEFIKSGLITHEGNHGRYIGVVVPFVLTYVNFKIGGFIALYVFGILLVALNGFLIYKIVGKNFPTEIAILTGLLFIIFPADTTKSLIVHIYQLQVSLMLALSGLLLYVNNKRILGFIVAFMSLLTYENAFLPFVLAPFFVVKKWDIILLKRFVVHVVIIGTVFATLLIIRLLFGESRVSEITTNEMIKRVLISFVVGPLTSVYSFFYSMIQTLSNIHLTYYLFLVILILIIISNQIFPNIISGKTITNEPVGKFLGIKAPENVIVLLKLMIIGIFISIIGYSLSFTHYPPTILKGRHTSVHFGAAFGIALFVAACIHLLFTPIKKAVWKRLLIYIFIICISLSASYGMLIQNDFVTSWKRQKFFWTGVLNQCPDLCENTFILVDISDAPETEYIISYSWASPLILENLYEFPAAWQSKPKLEILTDNFAQAIIEENGELYFVPYYPFLYEDRNAIKLENNRFIFLKLYNDHLTRLSGEYEVNHDIPIYLNEPEEMCINKMTNKSNLFKYLINDFELKY